MLTFGWAVCVRPVHRRRTPGSIFDKLLFMIYKMGQYGLDANLQSQYLTFSAFALINKEKHMMLKHWTISALALALALLVTFSVSGCAKKRISSEPPATTTTADEEARRQAEEQARQRELERQKTLKEEELGQESLSEKMAAERTESAKARFENEDIHFEFDSIRLTPIAQEILTQKAAWLRANPGAQVTIEGHCDSRGTNEYNLALGEGRAQSAKAFLVDLGIDPSRLTTISYGEERPIDRTQTEEAWAKNRRAHFVIEQ
jgi:peptidoglycan-associated lipoprotein